MNMRTIIKLGSAIVLATASQLCDLETAHASEVPMCLDGYVGSGVQVDADPAFEAEEFSVEVWFRREETFITSYNHLIVELESRFAMFAYNDGIFINSRFGYVEFEVNIPADVWTHIALVLRGNTLNLMVDGLFIGEVDAGPGSALNINGDMTYPDFESAIGIGRSIDGGAPGAIGALSEFRFWAVPRTRTEISINRARQIQQPQPGLIGVWSLDGSEQDAFGLWSSTLTGTATFCTSVPPSPASEGDERNPTITMCSATANPDLTFSGGGVAVRAGEDVSIPYVVGDNTDIATFSVTVDSVTVVDISLPGASDRTLSDVATVGPFAPGRHDVECVVVDDAGRVAVQRSHFFSIVDGEPPQVAIEVSISQPRRGDRVGIVAVAYDPSGIDSIDIVVPQLGVRLVCDGDGEPYATCTTQTEPLPAAPGWFEVQAQARDNEGLESAVIRRRFAYIDGIDTDFDGIPDVVEAQYCTDPFEADTDGDGLADGWEFDGLEFADGREVPLDEMGANPCYPDLFVRYIATEGTEVSAAVLAGTAAVFNRDLEFRVHWSKAIVRRRVADGQEVIPAAESAISFRDLETGDFALPATWTWTHHVVHTNHRVGSGSAIDLGYATVPAYDGNCSCPLEVDPYACRFEPHCTPKDDSRFTRLFIHELGHAIGLGHGGRVNAASQASFSPPLWRIIDTAGTGDDILYKPAYTSIMNYDYDLGVYCYNPGTGGITQSVAFTVGEAATLDERALPEQPGILGQTLLAMGCPGVPNARRAITWDCPSGSPYERLMSDGFQTIQRLTPRSWEGIPASDVLNGIDWNCDGIISSHPVRADIGGNSDEANELMFSPSDYGSVPRGGACVIFNAFGNCIAVPSEYRDEIPFGDAQELNCQPFDEPLDDCDLGSPLPGMPLRPSLEFETERPNGVDDDQDGLVDEGFPDTDGDTIPDIMDNCPLTPNVNQLDAAGDLVGDACQGHEPTVDVSADPLGVRVRVTGLSPDAKGVNVYRVAGGLTTYLGDGYPTVPLSADVQFLDTGAGQNQVQYLVASVDAVGQEGPRVLSNAIVSETECQVLTESSEQNQTVAVHAGALGTNVTIASLRLPDVPAWDPQVHGLRVVVEDEEGERVAVVDAPAASTWWVGRADQGFYRYIAPQFGGVVAVFVRRYGGDLHVDVTSAAFRHSAGVPRSGGLRARVEWGGGQDGACATSYFPDESCRRNPRRGRPSSIACRL